MRPMKFACLKLLDQRSQKFGSEPSTVWGGEGPIFFVCVCVAVY